MKRRIVFFAALSLLLFPAVMQAAEVNNMHPTFQVLDEDGAPVINSGKATSSDRTCGACHDAEYIRRHNSHFNDRVRAGCIECHFEGSRIPTGERSIDENGLLRREAMKISSPKNENCAYCHGLIHSEAAPLSLPENYESEGGKYDLTRRTGVMISSQNVSDSLLNIKNKSTLNYPWDVHAARMVKCTACHFSHNNPARVGGRRGDMEFLQSDPRRISTAEYLKRPDHRLAAAVCTDCHDPLAVHNFLPYKKRHFEVLSCGACHISALKGPALKSVNAAVVTADGLPPTEYRGFDDRPEGTSLNTTFSSGYTPFLLDEPDNGKEPGRIAPYNLLTETFWIEGSNDARVPLETVRKACLDENGYREEIIRGFDADGNSRLDAAELSLDSAKKIDLIKSALEKLGVRNPRLRSEVTPLEIHHGVMPGQRARKDCSRCHAVESTLNRDIALASFVPAGDFSDIKTNGMPEGAGEIVREGNGALVFRKNNASSRYYVFGHTRAAWSDLIGLLALAGVAVGVAMHGGYRIYTRKRRSAAHGEVERVYMYSAYERIWHWVMAFSVLLLILTGLQIHFAGNGQSTTMRIAVSVHNFFAVVLTVNAFLSFFYHLASNAIRQFIPSPKTLKSEVTAQTLYYLKGIFAGHPHPVQESPERKLNVLQQITYLLLLNVLLPLQILTGVMIWGVSHWPELAGYSGGLFIIAPLHNLGSWLFLSFFVLHFYLTTTGRTPMSNIRSMIDGYKEIETPAASAAQTQGGRNG